MNQENFRLLVLNRKDRLGLYQSRRLEEEAEKLGIDLWHVVAEDFEISDPIGESGVIYYQGDYEILPDAVMTRQTGMTYHAHALLRHFERRGVFVANTSEAIENAEDKLKTTQLLSAYEIPIPKTTLLGEFINEEYLEKEIGFPMIIKTVQGTKGGGVALAEDEFDLEYQVGELQETFGDDMPILAQEFIKTSRGKDMRVYVVGNKAIGAVIRQSDDPEEQFKANIALGGNATYQEVTPEIEKIAVSSAKALGLDFAGVDLLFNDHGFKVCEVNSSPSFEGFEKDAQVNVPKAMLEYILRET